MEGILNYKSTIGSGDTALGALNLCRDLSLLNRRNHEHTTRKGVPLVYHTKITTYRPHSSDADEIQVMKFQTVPSNWVYRNAAVKLHYAREAMMKKNGITKKERGRYDHTIRYAWENTDSSEGSSTGWLTPIDKDDNAFSSAELGTWDTTELILNDGTEVRPSLWGGISDQLEDTSNAGGNHSLALMYLQSRHLIREDDQDATNLEGDGAEQEFPGEFSIIRDLFNPGIDTMDEVRESVSESQDNPPYDADDISLTATFVEPINKAQTMTGLQSMVKDVVYVDIPFGIADVVGTVRNGASSRVIYYQVEVLGVSEMQG